MKILSNFVSIINKLKIGGAGSPKATLEVDGDLMVHESIQSEDKRHTISKVYTIQGLYGQNTHRLYLGRIKAGVHSFYLTNWGDNGYNSARFTLSLDWHDTSSLNEWLRHPGVGIISRDRSHDAAEYSNIYGFVVKTGVASQDKYQADIWLDFTIPSPISVAQSLYYYVDSFSYYETPFEKDNITPYDNSSTVFDSEKLEESFSIIVTEGNNNNGPVIKVGDSDNGNAHLQVFGDIQINSGIDDSGTTRFPDAETAGEKPKLDVQGTGFISGPLVIGANSTITNESFSANHYDPTGAGSDITTNSILNFYKPSNIEKSINIFRGGYIRNLISVDSSENIRIGHGGDTSLFKDVYIRTGTSPTTGIVFATGWSEYSRLEIQNKNGSGGTVKPCQIISGTGTPEGNVTANIGSLYMRLDGGAGTTLYVKESGTGSTGWVAK